MMMPVAGADCCFVTEAVPVAGEGEGMHSTPVSLLERLRRPNEQVAWERFVQLYTPLLCHWIRRQGWQGPEAADLVQDVFTVLVQRLPEFRYDPGKRFRAWLWTVTVNCCRQRQRRQPALVLRDDLAALSPTADADPAEAVAAEEYRLYLTRRAMELMRAEFQPSTWQAFWECVVNERPAAAVARELELSENAVYLARGRVLRRLRQELDGLLD
jgi:RNA polymerase sigma-70 factor (ECF subfamily)